MYIKMRLVSRTAELCEVNIQNRVINFAHIYTLIIISSKAHITQLVHPNLRYTPVQFAMVDFRALRNLVHKLFGLFGSCLVTLVVSVFKSGCTSLLIMRCEV